MSNNLEPAGGISNKQDAKPAIRWLRPYDYSSNLLVRRWVERMVLGFVDKLSLPKTKEKAKGKVKEEAQNTPKEVLIR